MSHQVTECPALHDTGTHNFSSWTTEPPLPDGVQVQRLRRQCWECGMVEWEDDNPDAARIIK